MAKIGNKLNEEIFLEGMATFGGIIKRDARRELRELASQASMIKTIEAGRTSRTDPSPVDLDPDDDLVIDDTTLEAAETELARLRVLFDAVTDERPPE
jgi:hypothetical protein